MFFKLEQKIKTKQCYDIRCYSYQVCYILSTMFHVAGMFDKQNRGVISFEDFGALWKYVSDWQNCFRSFDRDSSGNIDKVELKNALTAFGYRLSDEIINIMVQKFDRFGRGTILFDDFIQCCITLYVSGLMCL